MIWGGFSLWYLLYIWHENMGDSLCAKRWQLEENPNPPTCVVIRRVETIPESTVITTQFAYNYRSPPEPAIFTQRRRWFFVLFSLPTNTIIQNSHFYHFCTRSNTTPPRWLFKSHSYIHFLFLKCLLRDQTSSFFYCKFTCWYEETWWFYGAKHGYMTRETSAFCTIVCSKDRRARRKRERERLFFLLSLSWVKASVESILWWLVLVLLCRSTLKHRRSSTTPIMAPTNNDQSESSKASAAKAKARQAKKPRDMPSRPLSAYNFFFRSGESKSAWSSLE